MTSKPEPIKDILPRILAHNPSLEGLMRHIQSPALTEADPQLAVPVPVRVQVLNSFVKWHIPTSKFEPAKNHVQEMAKPFRGFNCSPSLGGWINSAGTWDIEDVQLVTSYATWEMLNNHFSNIVMGSYHLGKAIQENAIGLEIGTPQGNCMLIITTK